MEHTDPATTLLDGGPLPNFIAANLRFLRRRAGWSQTELAERVSLNRGNVASYESSSAEPSICKLLRIGQLFGVTTRDLTRRDLSDPAELALALSAHQAEDGYANYREQQATLAKLIESSHDLFEYKRAHMDQPCKEADILAAQYLQLLQLSRELLKEHGNLLDELACSNR